MIHGGGHITLSRRAVRPGQTRYLLKLGFLPISIDYRLCPEVNLVDGPMADVYDALRWAQSVLPPMIFSESGVRIDPGQVAAIGWSTGGHLAMSLAWAATEAGVQPPSAVLSFYAPTDFESGGMYRSIMCKTHNEEQNSDGLHNRAGPTTLHMASQTR